MSNKKGGGDKREVGGDEKLISFFTRRYAIFLSMDAPAGMSYVIG